MRIGVRSAGVFTRIPSALLVTAALALTAGAAEAPRPSKAPEAPARGTVSPPGWAPLPLEAWCPAIDPVATAALGMKAAIDPRTGQLREPTPEEMRTLALRPLQRLAVPKAVYESASGTIMVELDDSYMDEAVATRGPDGKLSFECVKGDANAHAKVVAGSQALPAPALETR